MKKVLLLLTAFICSAYGMAQNVTGSVTDQSGAPLPGVTVLIIGTNTGTTTDFDGNFKIGATQGDVLRFSYLGMKSKDVSVASNTPISIVLEEDTSALEEVVVTAFGVEKKQKSLGYSVTQVKAEDLNLAGQANAIESLQGRVAGVQINRTSGTSGGGVDILIRGITSVNPNRSNQQLIRIGVINL